MASCRVEFVNLKAANNANIISRVAATAYNITPGASPVVEPVCPAGFSFAVVVALEGNIVVDVGDNPGAGQENGKLVLEGTEQAFAIRAGQSVSVAEKT